MLKFLLLSSVILNSVFSGLVEVGDGRWGVNFFGFKAGLNFANGGVKAYAGTPTGQKAEAGLGGGVGSDGTGGGLFAGASTGFGQEARAGLAGGAGKAGTIGGLFAGASTGYGQEASAGLGGILDGKEPRLGLFSRALRRIRSIVWWR
ncbi:glycine-rich cell wall structural protein 1-like [Coccinella septempunctata]|uniref:glycine-rich cell wall structural protein 1-like n=1 Tax=Coccinella septempunctata TaxID=41139 RepID=UPI001D083B42|nr:glycine-rich cell wall structural protein 1-like [Coccinella septempunctata]